MADKKFTVNPGDEIIISVPRRNPNRAATGGSNSPRKGILRPRREDNYLPRRLNKPKGIQFYDLGQTKNSAGQWFTNPFSFVPGLFLISIINSNDSLIYVSRLVSYDVKNLEDSIVSVGVENFERTYRKIVKGQSKNVYLQAGGSDADYNNAYTHNFQNEADDAWTSSGLTLTESELANFNYISSQGIGLAFGNLFNAVYDFNNHSSDGTKFTLLYDCHADSVNFTPTNKDIWFMMPRINFRVATKQDFENRDFLNLDYRIKERYFDEENVVSDSFTSSQEALDRMRAVLPKRAYRIIPDGEYQALISTDPDAFTFGGAGTSGSVLHRSSADFTPGIKAGTTMYPFDYVLTAVVRQNNTYYYVWANRYGGNY